MATSRLQSAVSDLDPQALELQQFEVQPERLSVPEYCFCVTVDFAKSPKKDEGITHLKRILTGLLNASGGILEVRSIDGLTADESRMDKWKRNLEETLIGYIPLSIYRSCVQLVDYAYPIILVVFKSPRLITLCSNMYVRGLSGNRTVNDVDTIVDVINQVTEEPHSHPFEGAHSITYGDPVPVGEGPNVEYKYWGAVTKFSSRDKDTYKSRFEDFRTSKSLFAFPNMDAGGFLIIGVEEDSRSKKSIVRGQVIDEADEERLRHFLQEYLEEDEIGRPRIWGTSDSRREPQHGRDWSVDFYPVTGGPQKKRRMLIFIHFKHFVGGVMAHTPESYTIEKSGHIRKMTLTDWTKGIGIPSLETRGEQEDHKSVSTQTEEVYEEGEVVIVTLKETSCQTTDVLTDTEEYAGDQTDRETDCQTREGTSDVEMYMTESNQYGNSDDVATCTEPQSHPHNEPDGKIRKLREFDSNNEMNAQLETQTGETPSEVETQLQLLSWTRHKENWGDNLNTTSTSMKDSIHQFADVCSIFQFESPMLITPDRHTIIQSQPERRRDFIKQALQHIQTVNDRLAATKSFALAGSIWATNLSTPFTVTCPKHHIMDILVVAETSRIMLWTIMEDVEINLSDTWAYTLTTARATKRCMLFQQKNDTRSNFVTRIHIECHVYCLNRGERSPIMTSVYQHSVGDIMQTPKRMMNNLKSCLATVILKKETRIASIFGEELSIVLTAEQMNIILSLGLDKFNYIEGPPGSGKTYSALHLCQKFSNYSYIFSRPTFKSFLLHQGLGERRLFLASSSDEIMHHIDQDSFRNVELLVVDDVQSVSFSRQAWTRLFSVILENTRTKLVVFGDSTYQRYIKSPVSCQQVMQEFCSDHNCHMTMKALSQIHRNTRKVASFILSNFGDERAFPDKSMISCSHPEDGDDVEIIHLSDIFKRDGSNSLVKFVTDLTDPQKAFTDKDTAYEPRDIAILVDTPQPHVSASLLNQILRKQVPAEVTIADAGTFPVTGYTIDTLDNFMGLDRRVCILITGEEILKSTDPDGRSVVNPRYKTFAASRGITRVIFVVEVGLSTTLAAQFNLESLIPFVQTVWHEAPEDQIKDLCVTYIDHRPVVMYISVERGIQAFDFSGDPRSIQVSEQDVESLDRITAIVDGGQVIIAGWDDDDIGPFRWTVYDVAPGVLKKVNTYELSGQPWSACCTGDGCVVMIVGENMMKLSTKTGRKIWSVVGSGIDFTNSYRVTYKASRLYATNYDRGCVTQHRLEDGRQLRKISTLSVDRPWSLCVDRSQQWLFVGGSKSNEIYQLSMGADEERDGRLRKVVNAPGYVWELALHGDRFLAMATSSGVLICDVSKIL